MRGPKGILPSLVARKIAVRLAELGDGVLTDDEQEENEDAEA